MTLSIFLHSRHLLSQAIFLYLVLLAPFTPLCTSENLLNIILSFQMNTNYTQALYTPYILYYIYFSIYLHLNLVKIFFNLTCPKIITNHSEQSIIFFRILSINKIQIISFLIKIR